MYSCFIATAERFERTELVGKALTSLACPHMTIDFLTNRWQYPFQITNDEKSSSQEKTKPFWGMFVGRLSPRIKKIWLASSK